MLILKHWVFHIGIAITLSCGCADNKLNLNHHHLTIWHYTISTSLPFTSTNSTSEEFLRPFKIHKYWEGNGIVGKAQGVVRSFKDSFFLESSSVKEEHIAKDAFFNSPSKPTA